MKRLVYLVFTLFLAACGGSGGGSGSGTVATTPTDMSCLNGTTTCNTAAYGTYSGWTTYSFPYGQTSYTNYSTNGFCGCPVGFTPAYNGSMGLGCVNSMYISNVGSAVYMNFQGAIGYGGGGATINIPQYSNVPGYGGACSSNLAQSCVVGTVNSCGTTGATCQQVNSSNLGICVNPTQSIYGNGGYRIYSTGYPGWGYGRGYGMGIRFRAGFGFYY